jgi:hypothetical protein
MELAYGVLASEAHAPGELTVIGPAFDPDFLKLANYIDLNVVVHRRALFEELGGFDESLRCMVDWDLLLRYTQARPAKLLPVLGARYRVRDRARMTDTVPSGPAWLAIRRRLDARPAPPRRPRVLYVPWHDPQLSETCIEGEIRCMRRLGAEVAVWHSIGDLAALVREFRPDVIHAHSVSWALDQGDKLAALGVPVTLRMHGFEVHPDSCNAAGATLAAPRVRLAAATGAAGVAGSARAGGAGRLRHVLLQPRHDRRSAAWSCARAPACRARTSRCSSSSRSACPRTASFSPASR